MANYSTTANVVLNVNGKQAQKMLTSLQKDAQRLENQIAKAATAGDKASMKKLQRELNQTRRLMQQLQGSATTTEQTLQRLDKATPRELQKALRTLKNQLNGIERGTPAWDAHVAKIRAVREEIDSVNSSIDTQTSRLGRMWDKMKGGAMAVVAVLTGISVSVRKVVDDYAGMEQEMANVKKYTGMSAEEVSALNEEFKKIDTRSSREELNRLAQEAGRLGKKSQEDVLGFVRAADKINVALDDLGEGATLTLSKLTGVFGDEKRLGTEKALLSVGSVINELSQNCSASAPYIANFTSRIGGVGAEAGMTIQQIMAFAAVLDSAGQNVEKSSTALQQVIVRLYKDPAKYAEAAGMDVKKFTELVKSDMNSALIELLSTLHKVGKMDVLSPMFADMGESGSGAIATLSTLAGHIDEVKAQQIEANRAFAEATSINKEFEVQNSTFAASLDKSKNRLHEYSVELGEKLSPLMTQFYGLTGAGLEILSRAVSYFIEYRREILTVVAAIALYNTIVILQASGTELAAKATALYNGALRATSGIIPAIRLLMAALTNSIQYFTNGLQVNYTMQQRWRTAMEGMKFANWTGLILALASAVYLVAKNTETYSDKLKKAAGISDDFTSEIKREIDNLDTLFGKLDAAQKGTEEYRNAKDAIIKQYGQYLKGLIDEKGEIIDLEGAYNRLRSAIERTAQARLMDKIKENLDNAYIDEVNKLVSNIKDLLLQKGVSSRDVVKVTTQLYTKAASGEAITAKDIQNSLPNYYLPELDGSSKTNAQRFEEWLGIDKLFKSLPGYQKSIADNLESLSDLSSAYKNESKALENAKEGLKNFPEYSDEKIESTISALKSAISADNSAIAGDIIKNAGTQSLANSFKPKSLSDSVHDSMSKGTNELTVKLPDLKTSVGWSVQSQTMTRAQAEKLLSALEEELILRKGGMGSTADSSDDTGNLETTTTTTTTPSVSSDKPKGSGKASDKFAPVNEWRESQEALARIDYATGVTDFLQYTERMDEIAVEFYKKQLQHKDLSRSEILKISADLAEAEKKQQEHFDAEFLNDENSRYRDELAEIHQFYLDGEIDKAAHDKAIEEAEILHLVKMSRLYANGSAERLEVEKQLTQKLLEMQNKRNAETEKLEQEYASIKAKYFGDNPQERKAKYDEQIKALDVVYQREVEAAEGNADRIAEINKNYQEAKLEMQKEYGQQGEESQFDSYKKAINKSVEWLESDGGKAVTGTISTLSSGMSAIFSQVSSLVQAELDIQTAAINKRYDSEIERAQGNTYKVAKLEKQKEKEIAKAKADANRKMFAMQVIQAVAQTATNALNAYGSAAAIPVVGTVLAPIAAAMAVAAGMVQIAAIKKQQQASEAQGYAEGGFTRPGAKYEEAGVVHAGEWVASQKLVNNPKVRPLLEALDYAQKTNTIGTITQEDVSRQVTAPVILASRQPQPTPQVVTVSAPPVNVTTGDEYAATMQRLAERLDKPFVTVNTVTGDAGIKQAQDEYETLMRNKSPKNRK